jgi:hypothetical protein
MKYMLMMNVPAGGPYQIASWPADDIKAHMAFMRNFAGSAAIAPAWSDGSLPGPGGDCRVAR